MIGRLLKSIKRKLILASRKVSRFVDSPLNKFLTKGTLLIITGYFLLRKIANISFEDTLENYLREPALDLLVNSIILLVVYVFLTSILQLFFEHFPGISQRKTKPFDLANLHLLFNSEIEKNLSVLDEGYFSSDSASLVNSHAFDVNVRYVTDHLFDHLSGGGTGTKIRRRDLFISIFFTPGFEYGQSVSDSNELAYLLHCNPKRDHVRSKQIFLNRKKFNDYECVKACKNKESVVVQMDGKQYRKEGNKRSKLVELYIGMAIRVEGETVGFINIEFHRKSPFESNDEVVEYIESDLLSYRYLLEYQFLKKRFFTKLDNEKMNCNE